YINQHEYVTRLNMKFLSNKIQKKTQFKIHHPESNISDPLQTTN
ncbi:hypothetical protein X975_03742, partial [Stegodyphus mimosarum]